MTHTSTEQPEALLRLADSYADACFDQGLHRRANDDKTEAEREKLEKAIRSLHARVQELEATQAHIGAIARTALRTGSRDRQDWIDDMARIAGITQEKQG